MGKFFGLFGESGEGFLPNDVDGIDGSRGDFVGVRQK
jgi:hypothetical protein